MTDVIDDSTGPRDPEEHELVADPQATLERVLALVNSAPSLIFLKGREYRRG